MSMYNEYCISNQVSKSDIKQFKRLEAGEICKKPEFKDALTTDHFSWKFHKEYYYLIRRKSYDLTYKSVIKSLSTLYFYAHYIILAVKNCDNVVAKVQTIEHLYNLKNLRGDYFEKYEKMQAKLKSSNGLKSSGSRRSPSEEQLKFSSERPLSFSDIFKSKMTKSGSSLMRSNKSLLKSRSSKNF